MLSSVYYFLPNKTFRIKFCQIKFYVMGDCYTYQLIQFETKEKPFCFSCLQKLLKWCQGILSLASHLHFPSDQNTKFQRTYS